MKKPKDTKSEKYEFLYEYARSSFDNELLRFKNLEDKASSEPDFNTTPPETVLILDHVEPKTGDASEYLHESDNSKG